MSTMNLTLLTDFYELTMMQGYFKTQNTEKVVFDAFYRKNPCDGGYAIAAGLDQVIDYIKNLRFSKEAGRRCAEYRPLSPSPGAGERGGGDDCRALPEPQ